METFTLLVWLTGSEPVAVVSDLSKEECARWAQAALEREPAGGQAYCVPSKPDPFVIRPNPR
jgi:hypothetical protein